MKDKILHNLLLKIVALVTAMVLWLIIINVDDPVKMAEFDNVEVSLINYDVVTKNNKICEVLDKSNYISVKIYARRSILDSLDESHIRAIADLSDIEDSIKVADTANGNTYLDNVKITLSTNKNNNDLDNITASSDYVKVSIEDLKKIQKSITVELSGEPADGYVVGNVATNSNLVRIQGPASVVSRIANAKVIADISGFSDTISWDADIKLYDSYGTEVVSDTVTKSLDRVRTSVELLEKKEVKIATMVTGEPADGFGLSGVVNVNPSTITIAGKKGTLDSISKITIPASVLDVSGLANNLETTVNIKNYLPNDVKLIDYKYNGQVKVTVGVEEEASTTISVPLTQLSIANIPEGYTYHIVEPSNNMVVSVNGMREDLEEIKRDKIKATADFNQLSDTNGTFKVTENEEYEVEVYFEIGKGIRLQEPYKVVISLTKNE